MLQIKVFWSRYPPPPNVNVFTLSAPHPSPSSPTILIAVFLSAPLHLKTPWQESEGPGGADGTPSIQTCMSCSRWQRQGKWHKEFWLKIMLSVSQTVRAASLLQLIRRHGKRLLILLMMEVFNCKLRLIIFTEGFGEVVFHRMCCWFRRSLPPWSEWMRPRGTKRSIPFITITPVELSSPSQSCDGTACVDSIHNLLCRTGTKWLSKLFERRMWTFYTWGKHQELSVPTLERSVSVLALHG